MIYYVLSYENNCKKKIVFIVIVNNNIYNFIIEKRCNDILVSVIFLKIPSISLNEHNLK